MYVVEVEVEVEFEVEVGLAVDLDLGLELEYDLRIEYCRIDSLLEVLCSFMYALKLYLMIESVKIYEFELCLWYLRSLSG